LEVYSDVWSATIPVAGEFLGVNIGVMATPDTTDVVAYCPNNFAAGFTFLNATGRPQQVSLVSRSAPYDIFLNAVCTDAFYACLKWENKPFALSLAAGERKHIDIPMTCGWQPGEGPVSISYSYEGTTRQSTFYVYPYPSALIWNNSFSMSAPGSDRYPFSECELDWSLVVSPDGGYSATADFGRFDITTIDKSVEGDHWAGVQVKLRDMNLGQTWQNYKSFAHIEDSPSPYTTGGKQMTYVTYHASWATPTWQGVLPSLHTIYNELTRESPVVKLGCGVAGIFGVDEPSNPF
jgi:hypothetical protein